MRLAIRRPTVASSPASWQRACRIRAHRRGCTFSSTTTRAPCSGSSWRKPGSRGTGTAEQLALLLRTVGLGEVAHAFLVLPLRVRVLHRREQLRVEALRHVHTRHDDTGDLTLLDLVVDAREGDRELVLREGDVREVRIRAGHLLGVEMDVELALLTFAVHVPQRYYGRGNRHPAPARVRGHGAGGRGRRWDDRLPPLPPRAVVAVLLPRDGVRVADRTRHGPEKRRCAFADDLHGARGNHYLCLRRLAGRRSDRERGNRRSLGGTEEAENDRAAARPLHQLRVRSCRAAGGWGVAACRRAVRRLGLQPRCDRRRARGRGAVHRGQRHRRRRSRTCRARARAGARRRVRRRRRQSLHHALGSRSEPESADRRAGVDRRRREEAEARGRGPRRAALSRGRPRDGEPRPEAAGHRVRRRGHERHRRRSTVRGDRGDGRVQAGWEDDPRPRPAQTDGRARGRTAETRRHVRYDADSGGDRRGRRRADCRRNNGGADRARGDLRAARGARRVMPANTVERLAAEISRLADADVELERPHDPAHGDFATNVALRTAPLRKQAPREVAQRLAERVVGLREVDHAEVAGPGFLNLWLTRDWYVEALGEIGEEYGRGFAVPHQRILVELVSANPTGPLTVGSARNGAYGDSVARLLEFAGHQVEREHYVNDTGRQIDLFRESVEARRRGEEPPEGGYVGDYVADVAKLSGDPVEEMIALIGRELEEFRIHVDTWVRQSELEPEIPATLEQLETYERESARWLQTTAYGDDKDRVVVRSDGRTTYFAADAAYMRYKFERGFDRAFYILAADHHGYVARLQALADALGYGADRIEVPIYQLVNVVEGGATKKSSKRRGDVVFLRELIGAIGVDAARWYLVSRSADQPIDIDVDLAAERTQKNPVYYVQYAHARIAGILRNASAQPGGAPTELEKEERDLIKRLLELPGVAAEA